MQPANTWSLFLSTNVINKIHIVEKQTTIIDRIQFRESTPILGNNLGILLPWVRNASVGPRKRCFLPVQGTLGFYLFPELKIITLFGAGLAQRQTIDNHLSFIDDFLAAAFTFQAEAGAAQDGLQGRSENHFPIIE